MIQNNAVCKYKIPSALFVMRFAYVIYIRVPYAHDVTSVAFSPHCHSPFSFMKNTYEL